MTSSQGGGEQTGSPFGDYSDYKVYDENREHIGKVDDLFVDSYDRPEYMGVKMGFLGSSSTLIPMEIVRVNEERGLIQVYVDKEKVQQGPAFDDDQEIDAAYERRVREHYGLGEGSDASDASERGSYSAYYPEPDDPYVDVEYGERAEETADAGGTGVIDEGSSVRGGTLPDDDEARDRRREPSVTGAEGESIESRERVVSENRLGSDIDRDRRDPKEGSGNAGPGMTMGDREGGEFVEHPPEDEGVGERESDVEDEDELRVQRSEEELAAFKREREAGTVNIRKRVRTDRERMTVPKKHEEVKVERVPVSGEASEEDIGEQEVSMPVTEEEVEVTKRAVKKEEIRVRKESVEGEEIIEEDLRKEEVEVEGEGEMEDEGENRSRR